MWESFERRFAAEHALAAVVEARQLIGRLTDGPSPDDAALRAELDRLSYPGLRAFYATAVELTGGPSGREAVEDAERWRPHRDALLALRTAANAALTRRGAFRNDQLLARDLAAAELCAPIDARISGPVRAAVAGRATDADAERLAAAVRGYKAILSGAELSDDGRRLLLWKIANALNSLGRACVSSRRDAEAKVHFDAAAVTFAEAGEETAATRSLSSRDEAEQRLVPDADTRLEQLLAELAAAQESSVGRAVALVGLAELAHGNSDRFEASRWLGEAVAELAAAGYPLPGPDGTDLAVQAWIEAIPPGSDDDPTHFLRQFSAVLTVHSQVAALRMALDPGTAATAETELRRLAEIIMEMPAHTAAAEARLAAQLGRAAGGEAATPAGDPSGAEYLAVMASVSALLDLTEHASAGTPQTLAHWRQLAGDAIARARALGQPVTLAQALEAGARVEMAAGEPDAAIGLLEESYAQACTVGGKLATDQAIIAMSDVAKAQLGLGLSRVEQASAAAGKVIGLIERDRYRISAPFQQAALLAAHADVFAIGVFGAWRSGDYDTMLQRMELSKARASVRGLLLAGTGDSTEIDGRLRALNEEIHQLDPVISAESPPAEQAARRAAARAAQQPLRRQRLQLWDRRAIARRDPGALMPAVTLAGLQARLEPDEAVIYYYWLRPLTLLTVTLTADAIAVESKSVEARQRAVLERMIGVLGSLAGSVLGLDASYVAPLAPVLTPVEGLPLLAGKRRLVISPHRLLHWYPFAAMPYAGEPLVRSFAVRYAPNLTSMLAERPVRSAPRMTALAVSQFPGRPELDELHGVRAEAADITAVYAAAQVPALLSAEPARAQLLAALRDGALAGNWCLLIATHGHSLTDEVSRDAPLESVLELADGAVDGYEIAAAGLGCEVVVLTACYAGQRAVGGRGLAEQPGDELFGLSAAFLEAGCGSVLAPAWPADDRAMARLMAAFHRGLAGGSPADIALAEAQRAFLDTANAKEKHAYYWAPLMLTAIGRPMAMPTGAGAVNAASTPTRETSDG